MSMTYYAVTDDPNELAHFGIKGMKWGRRRTPEQLGHPRHTGSKRPRSAAYKKAQSKLGKMMKSGIKKAEAHWKAYNSPKAKEERFMKKAIQQARTGTLKYKKLTDAQVKKVTDRLALERNARLLGNTEKPSFGKRLTSAIGEGAVRGVGQGTTAYIEERFRGRGRTTAEIKADKRKARYENSLAGQRAQRKHAKAEQRKEYFKTVYAEGDVHPFDRMFATAGERAKYLARVKERNENLEYNRNLQKIREEAIARQRGNYEGGRYSIDRSARKVSIPSSSSALDRLNAYNESREKRNIHLNEALTKAEEERNRRMKDAMMTSTRRKRRGKR